LPIKGQDVNPKTDFQEAKMGINDERDIEANLQIGPTDQGMVRLFVAAEGLEIPMDFEPNEAREIAEELMVAAKAAELKKE
jgi:hypothetical protein